MITVSEDSASFYVDGISELLRQGLISVQRGKLTLIWHGTSPRWGDAFYVNQLTLRIRTSNRTLQNLLDLVGDGGRPIIPIIGNKDELIEALSHPSLLVSAAALEGVCPKIGLLSTSLFEILCESKTKPDLGQIYSLSAQVANYALRMLACAGTLSPGESRRVVRFIADHFLSVNDPKFILPASLDIVRKFWPLLEWIRDKVESFLKFVERPSAIVEFDAPLSELYQRRIGITGATGVIGSALAKRLLDENLKVRLNVLVRPNSSSKTKWDQLISEYPGHRVTLIEGDLRDGPALSQLVNQSDFLYHTALVSRDAFTRKDPGGDLYIWNFYHASLDNGTCKYEKTSLKANGQDPRLYRDKSGFFVGINVFDQPVAVQIAYKLSTTAETPENIKNAGTLIQALLGAKGGGSPEKKQVYVAASKMDGYKRLPFDFNFSYSLSVPGTDQSPNVTGHPGQDLIPGEVGTKYSAKIPYNTGVSPLTFASVGSHPVPAGLKIELDGTVDGTPTVATDLPASQSFEVQITDSSTPPVTVKKVFYLKVGAAGSLANAGGGAAGPGAKPA